MTISVRIDAKAKDIELMIAEDLSPEAVGAAVAEIAHQGLEEANEVNRAALGYVPAHDTFINSLPSADTRLDSVRSGGSILFEFRLLNDLFEWIDAMLLLNSPVKTGRYAKSYLFFVDGVEADISRPPQGSEAVFVNSQPYSRKIERGLSSQAPIGVFQGVATMAQSRFGNLAKIRFGYRSLPGGAVAEWAATSRLTPKHARLSSIKLRNWQTRQPAIIIGMS